MDEKGEKKMKMKDKKRDKGAINIKPCLRKFHNS
jgi:hypothetical protein